MTDVHIIYAASTLPLLPSECHLLRSLLNRRLALRAAEARSQPARSQPGDAGTGSDRGVLGGPVLTLTAAVEDAPSGEAFATGWQTAGASGAFKMQVDGIAACRIVCWWLRSGKIDGLPRGGVKMRFHLLGEPLPAPDHQQVRHNVTASGARKGWAQRQRFNSWDLSQQIDRERRTKKTPASDRALNAGLPLQAATDAGPSLDSASTQATFIKSRRPEEVVANLLREKAAASAKAWEQERLSVFDDMGEGGRRSEGAAIKLRLQQLQSRLVASVR